MLSRIMLAVAFSFAAALLVLCLPAHLLRGNGPAKSKPPVAEIPKELEAKTITLQEKEISLSKALAELAKQTGNEVEDRRRRKDDSKIKLELKKVTFWQALDTIAKEADARVSLYERDGKIALVDGPHKLMPVSYSGLFRVAVKRIDTTLLLEPDAHFCVIYLEVAWEPRFQPLLMETKPDALVAQDDKGRALEVPEGGQGRGTVRGRFATEIPVRLTAPHRSATALGLLKGKLRIVGPTKMLTFTFDKLAEIKEPAQVRKQTQEGVTVSLRELRNEGKEDEEQVWTVGLLLEYPAGGPQFESFQSYLVNNEIYLEKEKNGVKQRFPHNLGLDTDRQAENKADLHYHFADKPEENLLLGKFGDWKIVYRTPGKIAEVPIPFEFKDLPLP